MPNLLLLDDACHGWVESHRTKAWEQGLLVSQGQDPALVPVLLQQHLVFLTSDGGYTDMFEGDVA